MVRKFQFSCVCVAKKKGRRCSGGLKLAIRRKGGSRSSTGIVYSSEASQRPENFSKRLRLRLRIPFSNQQKDRFWLLLLGSRSFAAAVSPRSESALRREIIPN